MSQSNSAHDFMSPLRKRAKIEVPLESNKTELSQTYDTSLELFCQHEVYVAFLT